MNKTIIYGEVIKTINKNRCIYLVKTNSFSGDMIYKVNSTKKLRIKDKVIVVGQLIHNINYLDLSDDTEQKGLIRDNRELILEADFVEIKSTELGNLESTEKEAVDNAFDIHISVNDTNNISNTNSTYSINSIKW